MYLHLKPKIINESLSSRGDEVPFVNTFSYRNWEIETASVRRRRSGGTWRKFVDKPRKLKTDVLARWNGGWRRKMFLAASCVHFCTKDEWLRKGYCTRVNDSPAIWSRFRRFRIYETLNHFIRKFVHLRWFGNLGKFLPEFESTFLKEASYVIPGQFGFPKQLCRLDTDFARSRHEL